MSKVEVKALEWSDYEARSATGCYRVQRLDDKWEPLHDGYYMLPRRYGIVSAFATINEAKAYAQADYEQRIRSALTVQESEAGQSEKLWPGQTLGTVLKEMIAVATGQYDGYDETLDPWTADNRADVDRWQCIILDAFAATEGSTVYASPTPPPSEQSLQAQVEKLQESLRHIIKQWPDSFAALHAQATLNATSRAALRKDGQL